MTAYDKLSSRLAFFDMLRVCWRIAPSRRDMVRYYVITGFMAALGAVIPWLSGKSITAITSGGPSLLGRAAFWLILMAGIRSAQSFAERYKILAQNDFEMGVQKTMQTRLYSLMTELPLDWHHDKANSEIGSKIHDAVYAVTGFIRWDQFYVAGLFRLASDLVLLLILYPLIGAMTFCLAPLIIVISMRSSARIVTTRQAMRDAENKLHTFRWEFTGNILTVLCLRLQRFGERKLSEATDRIRPQARESRIAEWAGRERLSIFEELAVTPLVLLFVALHTHLDASQLGGMTIALMAYLNSVSSGVRYLASQESEMRDTKQKFSLLAELEQAHHATASRREIVPVPEWNRIVLRDLHFSYKGETRADQLNGVTIALERGKRIAVIGLSGAGKTTLLRIIAGLYEPSSGTLELDGAAAPFGLLRSAVTMVPQENACFEDTLKYNLIFDDSVGDTELDRCVDISALQPVMHSMGKGLASEVNRYGSNLSSGQSQRLALGRGLIFGRDSSVLLMDEPTSSLDAITEAQIFERLLSSRPDACLVVSLHRLHLLDRFDEVYVMEAGRIVEQGEFETLLAAEGKLFELWQAQRRKADGTETSEA